MFGKALAPAKITLIVNLLEEFKQFFFFFDRFAKQLQ
jgi:hypothetical protein